MLYRQFGCTGWKLSAVGIGCRSVAKQWGTITDGMAEEIVRIAYKSGINIFDATEDYGDLDGINEIRLGKALKGIRDKVYIAAKLKVEPCSPKDYKCSMEEKIKTSVQVSAERFNTDYIDILLFSGSSIISEEFVGGLNRLKKEGLIRQYGISTNNISELTRFYEMSEGGCKTVQLEYSMLDRSPEIELLPFCKENKLAVMIKSPLAKGLLSGKFNRITVFKDKARSNWNIGRESRANFERNLEKINEIKELLEDTSDMATTALRYVLSHEAEPIVVPGVTSPEQVFKNARAGLRLLTKEEIKSLKAIL